MIGKREGEWKVAKLQEEETRTWRMKIKIILPKIYKTLAWEGG